MTRRPLAPTHPPQGIILIRPPSQDIVFRLPPDIILFHPLDAQYPVVFQDSKIFLSTAIYEDSSSTIYVFLHDFFFPQFNLIYFSYISQHFLLLKAAEFHY